MTDTLKFSQQFIGVLNSVQAVGAIAGALFYAAFLEHLSLRTLLYWSVVVGVVAPLAFVFMTGPATGVIGYLCYGVSDMMITVASLGLAANYCPKRAEGFRCRADGDYQRLRLARRQCRLVSVRAYLQQRALSGDPRRRCFTAVNFLLIPLLKLGRSSTRELPPVNSCAPGNPQRSSRFPSAIDDGGCHDPPRLRRPGRGSRDTVERELARQTIRSATPKPRKATRTSLATGSERTKCKASARRHRRRQDRRNSRPQADHRARSREAVPGAWARTTYRQRRQPLRLRGRPSSKSSTPTRKPPKSSPARLGEVRSRYGRSPRLRGLPP